METISIDDSSSLRIFLARINKKVNAEKSLDVMTNHHNTTFYETYLITPVISRVHLMANRITADTQSYSLSSIFFPLSLSLLIFFKSHFLLKHLMNEQHHLPFLSLCCLQQSQFLCFICSMYG